MNIELKEITIQELSDGFEDNNEDGVVGFGGKLDIRPSYQREFIYKDKQRDAVINTITIVKMVPCSAIAGQQVINIPIISMNPAWQLPGSGLLRMEKNTISSAIPPWQRAGRR